MPKENTVKHSGRNDKNSMGETKIFSDLPLNDGEDFEFHPDFDEFGFFEDEIIREPEKEEDFSETPERPEDTRELVEEAEEVPGRRR